MPTFPRFIPLSESAESSSISGGSTCDVDEDKDPFLPDAQDPFGTAHGDISFELGDLDLHNTQDLLEQNPLPQLTGQAQDFAAGGHLAASTFGSPPTGPPPATNRKKSSSNRRKQSGTVSPDDSAALRPDSDSDTFAAIQEQKQRLRAAKHSSAPGQNMSPPPPNDEQLLAESGTESGTAQESSKSDSSTAKTSNAKTSNASGSASNSTASPSSTSDNSPNGEDSSASPENSSVPRKQKNSQPTGSDGSATLAHRTKRSNQELDARETDPEPPKKSKYVGKSKVELEADLQAFMGQQTKMDLKKNSGSRLTALTNTRRQLFVAQAKQEIAEHTNKKLIAELKDMRNREKLLLTNEEKILAELEKLKAQKLVKTSRAKAKLLRMCKEHKEKAESIAKEALWRCTKFISCPDEEDQAAYFVLKRMGLGQVLKDETQTASWIETYKTPIKKAVFSRRNYVTSELKNKVAFKHFLNKGRPLLSLANIIKCATRKIDPNDDDEMGMFMFYWTEILPKMVGSANWGKETKYYTTISKAKTKEDKPKRLITYSHEAMICVIWENNEKKWPELHEWKSKPENKGKDMPNMNGKYTITDGGQNEWGGWKAEGVEAYLAYGEEIKAGRKNPNCSQLEEITLQTLRISVGIDCVDHDTQMRRNRAKKRRKTNSEEPVDEPHQPIQRVVRSALNESDDEDE